MSETAITALSIVPYKILPAKLGGEKGIAIFNQYVADEIKLIAIGVKSNQVELAHNYKFLRVLSDHRIRYANIFLFFTVKKLLRENKATHLIIEHPYYGWLAWLIKITTKITWVVHSHNIEFQRSKSIGRSWWWALKIYEQWVYRSADINFFISEEDRDYAVNKLHIEASKCHAITYGVEIPKIPDDRQASKDFILAKHDLLKDTKILLFNGALYHHSNYEALQVILDKINPILLSSGIHYKILVCGKGLPASFNELKQYRDVNVVYAGFVDDISIYFKASDVFLNPINSGGGVKTKAIEAIAYNSTVVSTEFGAAGLVREVCGDKLKVVGNDDWKQFTNEILFSLQAQRDTPLAFYDYYFWGNLAKKVKNLLEK